MKLRRRFRFWQLVLIELSFAAAALATEHLWMLLVAGPITALSWYLVEGPRARALPRVAVNLGAVVVLILIGLSTLAEPDPGRTMELLAAFVLGILVLRQWQERTPREDAQQIFLALILVLSSVMQSEQLLFGILTLVWTATAIYVVILFQIHKGTDEARRLRNEVPGGERHLMPPLTARFGPMDLASVRRTTLLALVGVGLFGIVIFVIFPREILFKNRAPGRGGGARSGFNRNVDLVSSERISESRREVFTLQWRDASGEPMRWSWPILLRGSVLDDYESSVGKWSVPTGRRSRFSRVLRPPTDGSFMPLGLRPLEDGPQTYTIDVTMRSLSSNVVFAPWAPVAISATEGRTFQFNTRDLIIRDAGVDVLGSYWSYRLELRPFPREETLRDLTGVVDPSDVLVTFPVARVGEIARRILEERGESIEPLPDESVWDRNRRVSLALMNWLETNCSYTTDLGDFIQIVGEDPIVSFLERYRFGHCEFFASALTAMCRSVGVEARLVTGYIALEYDTGTESYVVRESNAHAWTEVRVGRQQWTSRDPSPQAVLEEIQTRNRSWADGWRWMYDRIDFLWNSSVVGFDTRTQAMLAKRATGGWESRVSNLIDGLVERVRSFNRFFRLGPAGYIWLSVILLLLFAFIAAGVALARRRRLVIRVARLDAGTDGRARELARRLGFWVDALAALERRGLVKAEHETPLAFSNRVGEVDPGAGRVLPALVELLYRIRFSDHVPGAEELARADTLVRSLRQEARS